MRTLAKTDRSQSYGDFETLREDRGRAVANTHTARVLKTQAHRSESVESWRIGRRAFVLGGSAACALVAGVVESQSPRKSTSRPSSAVSHLAASDACSTDHAFAACDTEPATAFDSDVLVSELEAMGTLVPRLLAWDPLRKHEVESTLFSSALRCAVFQILSSIYASAHVSNAAARIGALACIGAAASAAAHVGTHAALGRRLPKVDVYTAAARSTRSVMVNALQLGVFSACAFSVIPDAIPKDERVVVAGLAAGAAAVVFQSAQVAYRRRVVRTVRSASSCRTIASRVVVAADLAAVAAVEAAVLAAGLDPIVTL